MRLARLVRNCIQGEGFALVILEHILQFKLYIVSTNPFLDRHVCLILPKSLNPSSQCIQNLCQSYGVSVRFSYFDVVPIYGIRFFQNATHNISKMLEMGAPINKLWQILSDHLNCWPSQYLLGIMPILLQKPSLDHIWSITRPIKGGCSNSPFCYHRQKLE